MTASSHLIYKVRAALQPHGLFVRGVVSGSRNPDLMPKADSELSIQSVVLIGPLGGSNWSQFRAWQHVQPDQGGSHPLDSWSKAVLNPVAIQFGAEVWFPSDPPWLPFQKWAMAAEGLKPSPLGILIHPEYGLWHSYRGAFGLSAELDDKSQPEALHPCDTCFQKPCLNACPVNAIAENGFHIPSCRTHLKTEQGRVGCMKTGCLARNACPVGTAWRYSEDQIRYHMDALG